MYSRILILQFIESRVRLIGSQCNETVLKSQFYLLIIRYPVLSQVTVDCHWYFTKGSVSFVQKKVRSSRHRRY